MTVPVKKPRQIIHWRCSCCGRTADSSVKPGMTYGGKCSKAPNGMHRWVKDHF